MTKYILKRLLFGLLSAMAATVIIMVLIYSLMDREKIFAGDPAFTKQINNLRSTYMYRMWEEYGYLDYVTYTDYMNMLKKNGEIDLDEKEFKIASSIGRTPEKDTPEAKPYIEQFINYYESKGYKIVRANAVTQGKSNKLALGGKATLFAHKDKPLLGRVLKYFGGIFHIDNIHYVKDDEALVGERGLKFTLYDPIYQNKEKGIKKFSPAIIGNGTKHKYLLYCTDKFPFIHQNLFTVSLGVSYSVNQGVDIITTATQPQGSKVPSEVTYPTGLTEMSADNLHTAVYVAGVRENDPVAMDRFTDDYASVLTFKNTMSKVGFSFTLGIISTIIAYIIGLPLGILVAKKKDKLVDKLGTLYIVFSISVPALAYIFMVRALGAMTGLPTTFDIEHSTWLMYLLPIISLSLPSIANLMKWMRRFMIDQTNSDYVRFARSGGLSDGEIFNKHIFKNAVIPLVHGIPGSVLFAMTGAFYTESVYVVPGAGKLFVNAVGLYDNSVIVGIALFYALLTVISLILGDLFMALSDPRISFIDKAR